jgi:hypothetical protein
MSAVIYWIRSKEHTDITCQGYVGAAGRTLPKGGGVTSGLSKQIASWTTHRRPRPSTNMGWDNLIKEIVLIADEQYCYDIEGKLRPECKVGWNLAVGGCKPPVSKSRGPDYVSPLKGVTRSTPWMIGRTPSNKGLSASEETRAKLSAKKKGTKQTPEQIAKRVAARRATLAAQGRTVGRLVF